MSRRIWLGVGAVVLPLLALAAIGVYALVEGQGSGDGPLLPGIALARPPIAAEAAPAFPVASAGLSAYVQMDPISGDFVTKVVDKVTPLFSGMMSAGDNNMIG